MLMVVMVLIIEQSPIIVHARFYTFLLACLTPNIHHWKYSTYSYGSTKNLSYSLLNKVNFNLYHAHLVTLRISEGLDNMGQACHG